MMIIKEVLKLVSKARDLKLVKNTSNVARELSDAILMETQEDMKSEL
jgi:hypothetical protein